MMPHLRLIKANDMKRMPWQNGGGETLEVAIHPQGAELAKLDFDWRVSIATIASDGPFSTFRGYDRKLVVWSGESLLVNGVERLATQPFEFSGEEKIATALVASPIKDFGVITKRGSFKSTLTCHSLDEQAVGAVQATGDSFILCSRGELRIGEFYLNPGDVIHVTGAQTVLITALERADYVIASVI